MKARIRSALLLLLLTAFLTACAVDTGSSAAPTRSVQPASSMQPANSVSPVSSAAPASSTASIPSVHLTREAAQRAHRMLSFNGARIDENGKIAVSANASMDEDLLAGLDAISVFYHYDAWYVLQPGGLLRVIYRTNATYEQMGIDRNAAAAFYAELNEKLQALSVVDMQFSLDIHGVLLLTADGDVYQICPHDRFDRIAEGAAMIRSNYILFSDGRLASTAHERLDVLPEDWSDVVDLMSVSLDWISPSSGGIIIGLRADGSLRYAVPSVDFSDFFELCNTDETALQLIPGTLTIRTADHRLLPLFRSKDSGAAEPVLHCAPDAVAVYASNFDFELLPDGTMHPIQISASDDDPVGSYEMWWGSVPVRTKMPIQ